MRIPSPSLCLTFSSRFLQAFFAETGTEPERQRRLMEQADMAPDTLNAANGRVTEDQFSSLYRSIASETDDEMLNLLSRPIPGGTMKYAGYIMISAPTAGVALYRFSRFLRMLNRDFDVKILRDGKTASIVVEGLGERPQSRAIARQLTLKVFHGMGSWLTGQPIELIDVDFDFPAPPYTEDIYALLPGRINFDRPATAMHFDASVLDLKIHRSERELRTFLARQPRDWLLPPSVRQPVAHQVRACLLEGDVGAMKAPDIAKALNMSLRTLCRRLALEGASVKDVKDALRRDLAIHRLTQTQESISKIAESLGFGDNPSFYRAFRSWTGVAPGAYRRGVDDQTLGVTPNA